MVDVDFESSHIFVDPASDLNQGLFLLSHATHAIHLNSLRNEKFNFKRWNSFFSPGSKTPGLLHCSAENYRWLQMSTLLKSFLWDLEQCLLVTSSPCFVAETPNHTQFACCCGNSLFTDSSSCSAQALTCKSHEWKGKKTQRRSVLIYAATGGRSTVKYLKNADEIWHQKMKLRPSLGHISHIFFLWLFFIMFIFLGFMY